jgi:hypothetical protein
MPGVEIETPGYFHRVPLGQNSRILEDGGSRWVKKRDRTFVRSLRVSNPLDFDFFGLSR